MSFPGCPSGHSSTREITLTRSGDSWGIRRSLTRTQFPAGDNARFSVCLLPRVRALFHLPSRQRVHATENSSGKNQNRQYLKPWKLFGRPICRLTPWLPLLGSSVDERDSGASLDVDAGAVKPHACDWSGVESMGCPSRGIARSCIDINPSRVRSESEHEVTGYIHERKLCEVLFDSNLNTEITQEKSIRLRVCEINMSKIDVHHHWHPEMYQEGK